MLSWDPLDVSGNIGVGLEELFNLVAHAGIVDVDALHWSEEAVGGFGDVALLVKAVDDGSGVGGILQFLI